MTPRKPSLLSWSDEVKSVLAEGGLAMADLAHELGVNRATVRRYFTHHPKSETITRVSEGVATLLLPKTLRAEAKDRSVVRVDRMPDEPPGDKAQRARDDIARYLEAVAAFEFSGPVDAAELGLRLGFQFIKAFLEPVAVDLVYAVLSRQTGNDMARKIPRDKWRVTKLGLSLLLELRRIAFDLARASYPATSRFDRIAGLFEDADASLKDRLKRKRALLPMLIYERFHARIADAIARRLPDRNERLHLHDDIGSATRQLIDELNNEIPPTLLPGRSDS